MHRAAWIIAALPSAASFAFRGARLRITMIEAGSAIEVDSTP